MSGRKRSSIRAIRRPVRYGDSVLGSKRKSDKNNGKGYNKENRKDDEAKNQGEGNEYKGVENKGDENVFDGDLNGDEFPGLHSQVSAESSTANNVNKNCELDNLVNNDKVVTESNENGICNGSTVNANEASANAKWILVLI